MILIHSDHDRLITIPGVPAPVRRPVDVDASATGFTSLRTLRIYRFDADSIIEGHAEEDEVVLVVISGSIELTIIEESSRELPGPLVLSDSRHSEAGPRAAYLPPHSAYKLATHTEAEVAYARSTPAVGSPSKIFLSSSRTTSPGTHVLLEETTYAERLRFRLVEFDAQHQDVAFAPVDEADGECEALVYVRAVKGAQGLARMTTRDGAQLSIDSSDTVAVPPGELPALHFTMGSSGVMLVVMAT